MTNTDLTRRRRRQPSRRARAAIATAAVLVAALPAAPAAAQPTPDRGVPDPLARGPYPVEKVGNRCPRAPHRISILDRRAARRMERDTAGRGTRR
ncbi:hypothetical protein [Conexibacter woesei]|uniref:hypothetical protein n=1 Tax=Conexibacter woesei TaxID=191495 RepID=UPI00059F1195|nr:hypothetical protein [Conexibacter woesei]